MKTSILKVRSPGVLQVTLRTNVALLQFNNSRAAAQAVLTALKPGLKTGPTYLNANVTITWKTTPEPADKTVVGACIEKAGAPTPKTTTTTTTTTTNAASAATAIYSRDQAAITADLQAPFGGQVGVTPKLLNDLHAIAEALKNPALNWSAELRANVLHGIFEGVAGPVCQSVGSCNLVILQALGLSQ